VPGVEKMPYPKLFGFLEYFVIDLGGSTGSLGVDSVQRAFPLAGTDPLIQIGAPICYESVYGELFGKFVLNGAQIMSVITNDAWWSTSPGHRQHFELSKLRAIESRKYVLRSANTGISAFIDPLGKSSQETTYGTRTAIRETVYPNNEITFYVKHGDYLARFALAVSAVLVLFQIILTIRNRVSRKKRLVR
jgi:apolipoprotein N-acyltransferase